MKPDFSLATIVWIVTLTFASQVACSTLNSGGQIRRFSCDSHIYRDLLALRDTHNCTGENQVLRMLDHLYHERNGHDCMKQAIMYLSERFGEHMPDYCNCSGSNIMHTYPIVPNTGDNIHECWNEQSYDYLYRTHFTSHRHQAQPYDCRSHHTLWHTLATIHSDTCRNDIVLHLSSTIQSSGDPCSCVKHTDDEDVQQITISTKAPSDQCLQYGSYKYLYNLGQHAGLCVSVNNMWHYLADLHHRDINCRKKIMDHMAAIFHDYSNSPNYCTCTGHDTHHNIVHVAHGNQIYCSKNHEIYRLLHREIYENSPTVCRSHQYLWQKLLTITIGEHEIDCRADLILHAAATFPHPRNDPCSCTHASSSLTQSATNSVAEPTMFAFTSTTKLTATSTAASTTSTKEATENLIGLHVCSKASTISSILHNLTVTHASASDCARGDHTSSEALVLKNCNASSTTTWIKGENVKTMCNSIPLFTPIATFKDRVFEPNGGRAGIFLGCLPDGFKFAVQDCLVGTQIKHLQSGAFGANDPSNYFVIRW